VNPVNITIAAVLPRYRRCRSHGNDTGNQHRDIVPAEFHAAYYSESLAFARIIGGTRFLAGRYGSWGIACESASH
jgi:hypothetical protein